MLSQAVLVLSETVLSARNRTTEQARLDTSPKRKRVTHSAIKMFQSDPKAETGKTEIHPDSNCQIELQTRAFVEPLAGASGLY